MENENMYNGPEDNQETEFVTDKLLETEFDKIDPESGLTWRELVYGVSKKTLKDIAKDKEPKEIDDNLFETLYPEKKEKKHVSKDDAMKLVENYHDVVTKLRTFLAVYAPKYFPSLSEDDALEEMELVALQTLMRSQDEATLDAVKDILKEEDTEIEIDGKSKKLFRLLFPKKKDIEEEEEEAKVSEETQEKREPTVDESLIALRNYYDLVAKMYGMLDTKVNKFYPNVGEHIEENRLAILAIESCLHLHDKASFHAVETILKNERKYIKENKGTPLAKLFKEIEPEIEVLRKEFDK